MSLAGKVAIVTGASAGIGLAVTEQLLARGATVVMVARSQAPLDAAAARLGPKAIPWPADVADLAAMAALPAAVVARCDRLDILVNNAGLHHRGPVLKHGTDALADMVTVNLSAPIVLVRAALPFLPDGGAIVNVASLAGCVPRPGAATYSATKAGLRFFTRALADEHPRLHISAVNPGPVDTGFFGDISQVEDSTFSQPMSTAGQVADAVLRCLDLPSTEIALPRASGWLTTLAYAWPWLARTLNPYFKRRGAENKRIYMDRKARERAGGA